MTETTSSTSQEFNALELQSKLQELDTSIKDHHPSLPTLLKQIWLTLKQYPEQVVLLKDEDRSIIVRGLEIQTGVELAKTVKTPSASKALRDAIKTKGVDAF